ncbi:RluA family pseudouridine synthase [Hyphomonas johnsonii]|uniref:Pseudouridine synthase family protein n=1 Tax=Hyphomonas johnsonii MHS-2 TaxID=1280950 RepID=A0A059FVH7_9PROT|nr:RluA family pseudouridine synthase [Hyphomonas johnsonii]KCZ94501.1 pseudouridine synthase family protein [Hyphomonas johnsonii MHS-2]
MTRNRPVPVFSPEDESFVRSLVLFQDSDVMVFNKPSGLPVQSGSGVDRSLDSLLGVFARSNGKRPRLVHRLDVGTSGIVIVAKTKPAAAFLSAEFSERRAKKTYVALVGGELPLASEGRIDLPLVKVKEMGRDRMIAARPGRAGAQSARTGWRILQSNGGSAMFELSPETGRMHQIRIHLAHLGCPIVGDGLYGGECNGRERLMLHAAALDITLPSGERQAFAAPVPGEFADAQRARGLTGQSGL